ncbi:hypothetical protein [Candidatus Enterococcus ikei]|uniref:Yip1 domain-containing protein n=1 Tax=Candidatus Enterococcus ikei TaxID=2815326 RepID=A0ABS3GWE1_9ENTE|nr:hypothetical protein [Enterococcus sp. DIV0869a]MBO0439590.1 hypothetical protein [Enterococcus sp. DIV0869a]
MDIKLKVVFEKENKKKSEVKQYFNDNMPRLLFSSGVAGFSSIYYVSVMYQLDKTGFFKASKEKIDLPFEIYLATVLFMIGLWAILYACAIYAGKSNNDAMITLTVAFLSFIVLFFASFLLMNSPQTTAGWITCIMIWCLLICSICSFILLTISSLIKKFMLLDNQEQFTIGLAVFTFILGILLK